MLRKSFLHSTLDTVSSAANYPALKLHIPASNVAANGDAVDVISGQTISLGGVWNASAVANAVRSSSIITGVALPSTIVVGTKSALLFVVANFSVFSLTSMAVGASARMQLGAGVNVYDGVNTATSAVGTTAGAVYGYGLQFISGTSNELTLFKNQLTTASYSLTNASATPGDLTNIGNFTHMVLGNGAGSSNFDFYDLKLFVFDTTPTQAEIKNAVAWMTARAQQGDYRPYPLFAGRT